MTFDARLLSGVGVMTAVVENGGFARAAEAVGLTPSGVSRAIARLEAQVGARLFERHPRMVALTEAGARFHAEVAPLLAGITEAAETAAADSSQVRGRLKLSVDPWFARIVLAPRLPALLARYPELSLELRVTNAFEEMLAGGVDLAIRFGPPPSSGLIARKLLDTRSLQSPRRLTWSAALLFARPPTSPSTTRSCSVIRSPGGRSPGSSIVAARRSKPLSPAALCWTTLPRRWPPASRD